ncbi:hypothetical protein ACF1AJ_20465 [Leifsonia sp. NPDC014704]|uniref:hypothetical protein n=1 Tax=Leifsonia sp. NPDC014704 TaxID=3364123 RepID=UPI0036F49DE0
MTVDIEKIAVALGQTAPEPDSLVAKQWELWIDDAEMLIDARVEKLGVETPDEAKIDYVVREAVVAHIKRPDDATQVTVSVDDGSASKTYRSGKGRVAILDEWWTFLGLTEPSGAFSVDMVGPVGLGVHAPYCNLMFPGGTTCSCGANIAGRPIYEGGEDW